MSYTRVLRWVLFLGLGLIFFIPFLLADGSFLPNMFFPYITGKNFVFRILIELMLGAYIILALREPKYRPKASYILWALGAFMLWMGLATVLSVDPIKSFWSNFERMEGYVTLMHLFVYFLIVGTVVAVEDWWERFFQVSIGASMIMGSYALLQLLGVVAISSQSGARVDTTFGNAAYLGVYMLFNVFITLFMLVRQRKLPWAQMVYGLAIVLQFTTIFYTQTRGALLGVVGGLIIAAIYTAVRATDHEWRTLRKISLWGLGSMAVIILLFLALRTTPIIKSSPTLNRIASISLTDPTTMSRFAIWNMAWQGFKEKPIQGWGQENFNFVFNKYYEPKMYAQEQWFDRAHNQFLDWLIAGGLPAFLLYLSLFGLMAWVIIKSDKLTVPEQAVLLGLLAGYAFNNMLVFNDLMSSIYFFALLAFVYALSRRPVHRLMVLSKPMNDRGVAVMAPMVAVVIVFMLWTLNAPGIARGQNLLNAIMTQVPNGQGGAAAKDPKLNLEQFKIALGTGVWPGTGLGYQEATEQLMQFSSSQAQSNVDASVKKETHDLTEMAGKTILAQRENDARLSLFLGAFYDSFGQHKEALEYLNRALADSPRKQQIQFQIGVVNINSGNIPAAVAVLKAAFDAESNFKDARILYAAALIYSGDKATADKILTEGPQDQGFGSVYVDDSRLLQVYANTKQHDRVIEVWNRRVAANPGDAQQHIGLAAAYFAAGDAANTVAALQAAAAKDPTVATQAQAIIKQIQDGTLKPGQ